MTEKQKIIEEQRHEREAIEGQKNQQAVKVVEAYINDFFSFYRSEFLIKLGISIDTFRSYVRRVEKNYPELYQKYLQKVEDNKKNRVIYPCSAIVNIITGIQSGRTINGEKFNIYTFYRLAPFKFMNFDLEMIQLKKDFKEIEKVNKSRQQFIENGTGLRHGSWSENLYIFTYSFNPEFAEILKQYMLENNIVNLTPISKGRTTRTTFRTEDNIEFTTQDAVDMFDEMEQMELPKCLEVYNLLRKDRLSIKPRTAKK